MCDVRVFLINFFNLEYMYTEMGVRLTWRERRVRDVRDEREGT